MYKKDTALEIQFAPERLNDGAGVPYWIDLSTEEARQLMQHLQAHFAQERAPAVATPVFALDEGDASRPGDAAPIASAASQNETAFKQWVCVICGWIYDEAAGLPEEGIAPGTRWVEIPDSWRCPLCDVGKEDFALVEF
jgi:rubredoxin